MQVKEAIKYLSELKPDQEIIIAWWEKPEAFTVEEWENVINREGKIDWSIINEDFDILKED